MSADITERHPGDSTPEPDVQPYALLASAIAGRDLHVQHSDVELAYWDGYTIYLPRHCVDAGPIRQTLVAQAMLIAGGSCQRAILRQLANRPRSVPRYITLELTRIAEVMQHSLPRRLLLGLREHGCEAIPVDAEDSLRRALGRERLPALPAAFGTLKPRQLLKRAVDGDAIETELGEAVRQAVEQQIEGQAREDEDAEEQEDPISGLMADASTSLNRLSELFKDMVGSTRTRSPDDKKRDGSAELSAGGSRLINKLNAGMSLVATTLGLESSAADRDGHSSSYPEWDCWQGGFREHWCHVSHFEPDVSGGEEDLHDLAPDLMLRRRLARLGMASERYSRQLDGENLDISALVEFAVDNRLGAAAGRPQVYETRKKTARDLGVIVLLDVSGSTQDFVHAADYSIWNQQQILAMKLIQGLEEVGDCVAAYGFRSSGRNDVRFLRIKQFDKRFDLAARRRLLSLRPAGYTRLGAAIRHAADLLASEAGTSNQLLVVLSDGFPYDIEYSETYAEQDVRHALQESTEAGVGCVCMNIGSAADAEMLERVWGNVGHATLASPNELSRHVEPLFRAAIQRAASGGRVQRRVRRFTAAS